MLITCTWHSMWYYYNRKFFLIVFVMLDFVSVTFFKCLFDIILLYFLYIRTVHIFVVDRKEQVIGVTSVVLTLLFHSNDIVVCHFFFLFCILELAYVACEPGTLYNDIVWLLNQDTCQLSYKSWILL